ncbi:unnamed protein product [Rhizopus microsporus]
MLWSQGERINNYSQRQAADSVQVPQFNPSSYDMNASSNSVPHVDTSNEDYDYNPMSYLLSDDLLDFNQNTQSMEDKARDRAISVLSAEQRVLRKSITRQREINYKIPASKSKGLFSQLDFSCELTCCQHISYDLPYELEYKTVDLEKLDIVLNQQNTLEHTAWMSTALINVMSKCGLVLMCDLPQKKGYCMFRMPNAFINTPASYLLETPVPHEKHNILLSLTRHPFLLHPREFQKLWLSKDNPVMLEYVEKALWGAIIRKTCQLYPLIFSNAYVKRTSSAMAYLPCISQSIYRVMETARVASKSDFVDKITSNLEVIEENTRTMRPTVEGGGGSKDDVFNITTTLTLGLYHCIKNQHKRKSTQLSPVAVQRPPDANNTITHLWSITCSTNSVNFI